ncbi:MAG: 5-methyltetrahydropteroyltriglutamate--homocysteine S-methyltransferase [Turneriella sp.]|nr:5-methyltetrahydropteroyltriglutamate--homocysteine S-methyltransferase [Turneriella sp.]
MKTNNLGYPRIGVKRELKKTLEDYWSGQCGHEDLLLAGSSLRRHNWQLQQSVGIDLIPSNDFSFYDHVLDMSLLVGNIPERYLPLLEKLSFQEADLLFAMARGYQKDGHDITAMEMTKWFDTNYHYIVPEFRKGQKFRRFSDKPLREYREAKELGIETKPVLLGPVSYLLLGKEKEPGFHRLELLEDLLPVYVSLLEEFSALGVSWVEFDEPYLALDIDHDSYAAFVQAYQVLKATHKTGAPRILLATYFEGVADKIELLRTLQMDALHIDLVRRPEQLGELLPNLPETMLLSLGVVDGRNIWKNDLDHSLRLIGQAKDALGEERILIAPSCSLLHVPCDLAAETDSKKLPGQVKNWLAFAQQKLEEVVLLRQLASAPQDPELARKRQEHQRHIAERKNSTLIHNPKVKERLAQLSPQDFARKKPFAQREQAQVEKLRLPLFPTTTIGSFPQTAEIRRVRAQFNKGEIGQEEYENFLRKEIERVIHWQENLGFDVLVHGEFERTDMVEYFASLLQGFALTKNGWVQSYGSRCVKPPIIYGDVARPQPMTVSWAKFAQSLTKKPVKGMLTGPVTMLQWSFVRDDQPRSETAFQIALAIRDEVRDLEEAGISIIQIDEAAIREGLPLRKKDQPHYLDWAVRSFRLASAGAKDETQIHTHMCYSEFNEIIEQIAALDADVVTIECSRSQMELLDAFRDFHYPAQIGPGVYDIHSPRVPTEQEITALLEKAVQLLPARQLWVNPDCGLKTRNWPETEKALSVMVRAAQKMRARLAGTEQAMR